ncbi:MFS transporter [Sphingomonas sp. LB-2]|uniref:spinster family MFS transporter n=1 Tax=Sphingomonas caeni TaxID=2984949 RepID=UPI00222F8CAC|nr:MFS transporter [Sphingomonas caeni]MCW3848596.1 MFS transporter [Sphingomonas caeni]
MNTPAEQPASAPPHRTRVMVFMLFVVCSLNFADRAVFSALAQTIKADLHLTDLELGLLQGLVFALLYALVGLPIGLLAERFSRKRIVALATAIWSAATIGTGFAGNFVQLAANRLIVGMGEAGFTPCAASMVGDVTPRNKRASTMSLVLLGTPVGIFAGATLAGQIAASWGWRAAFVAFGVPGLIMAALFLLFVQEPRRGMIDNAGAAPEPAPPIGTFLATVIGNRPLVWVIAGGSLAGFGMTSISQFLAVFLARSHDLGIREAAAAFGSVSGISIAFGLLVGSFGTDYLSRRDPRWPAWGAAIGLICAPPIYLAAFHAESLTTAIVLLLVAGSFLLMFFGPTAGMIQNLLPPRMRASGVALYTLLYTLIGSGLGPVFVGGMSDVFAAQAYPGNYLTDCPHGLAPGGALAERVAACAGASASGLQMALSLSVLSFFVAAGCFLLAATGLKHKAQTSA